VTDFLLALVPSAGVLFLFVIGIRALLHADRRERTAAAQFERDQDPPEVSAE
jgi:hypothetical protein